MTASAPDALVRATGLSRSFGPVRAVADLSFDVKRGEMFGLIGPDGTPRDYPGSLAGTPVFLGCSDIDPHIPLARVRETTAVLRRLGGAVTERIYPGLGHLINEDEIRSVQGLLAAIARDASGPERETP